ncbi:MAG TPA: hypothetical protein VFP03_09940 [Jiangellaceae bacterium]|nr:hypothetical protein [Jiangellaceae bacterium]
MVGQIDHPVLEIALRWVNLDDPRKPPAPPRMTGQKTVPTMEAGLDWSTSN